MQSSNTSLGTLLDAWLIRLDQAGFQVGIRERLQVQKLLLQFSVANALQPPQTLQDILKLLQPLLCSNPEQQHQYTQLLTEFVAQQQSVEQPRKPLESVNPTTENQSQKPKKLGLIVLVIVVMVCIASWMGWFELKPRIFPDPTEPQATQPEVNTEQQLPLPLPNTVEVTKNIESKAAQPTPIPIAPISDTTAESNALPTAAWIKPLRIGLIAIGVLALLLVIALMIAHWRRQYYLQGVSTDQAIEESFLTDPNPMRLEPKPSLMHQAARLLRQRQSGEQSALHLQATLQATVKAGGVLSPRYRTVSQTPEYLALIDQRHPADHQAYVSKVMLDALIAQGVAIQIFYFEDSPQAGCWRLHPTTHEGNESQRITFTELATRYWGHRLLIFSGSQALVDAISGQPQSWVKDLAAFPQRAWFTSLPVATWGWMEQIVEAQHFLLLPLQPEALMTAGNWFADGQPDLQVANDWPRHYPTLLLDPTLIWVIRQTAPSAAIQEELLFQLRNYLGALRFQWLCACAVFPALSPALTLALGRELSDDPRDGWLGMNALGTLPWFRYAYLPNWLRSILLERLSVANEARFRQVIESKLATALVGVNGTPLVSLVQSRRRLMAWFYQRSFLARDGVMVDFLQRSLHPNLAQRLPEGLRKRLFRQGQPVYGFSRGVLGLLPLGLLLGWLGWLGDPAWFDSTKPQPPVEEKAVTTPSEIPPSIIAGDSPPNLIENRETSPGPDLATGVAEQTAAIPIPPLKPLFKSTATVTATVADKSPTDVVSEPIPTPSINPAESITQLAALTNQAALLPFEPEMVRIPPGSFIMGSPDTERGRYPNEGPQHQVTLAYPFEIGRYEVTFAQYDAFTTDTQRERAADQGLGRGNRPVINVSWYDAQAYVKWLSDKTGKKYRLPSEAEWEYVARAGSTTAYWWGDIIGKNNAVCNDCGSQWDSQKTAPVGSFKPNAFGVYDSAGNVWEWTQDCWHDNYTHAPNDGSAWLEKDGGDCSLRVLRGGFWYGNPLDLRSASRSRYSDDAFFYIGFRVARDSGSPKSPEASSDSLPSLYILPKQSFQVDKIAEALDKLFAENDGNDNVILYVHGRSGGKKKEPIKSLENVMPGLRDDYTAKVIMFSWPDSGDGGVNGFPENRAREAAPALAKTLMALNQYKLANSERLKNVKFTLILHSMGNIVFEQFLSLYNPGTLEKQLFDTVVLSSSASKSKDHSTWLRKMDFSPHRYVTVNDDDKILIAAGIQQRGKRLGKEIVDNELVPQATYVDVTNAHVNHAYFIFSGQKDNICLRGFYEKIMNGEKFSFENTADCNWVKLQRGGAMIYRLK